MSARPASWEPLTDGDPVPGDPDEVIILSRHYGDTAAEIVSQVAALRRLAETTWDSEAGKVFSDAARECAEHLEQAHERYAAVGSALRDWSTPLEHAQASSLTLLDQAREAAGRQASNAPVPQMRAANGPPPTAEQQAAAAAAERARQSRYEDATSDLAAVRGRLGQLVQDLDDTARRLADGIRHVTKHDGLHDSRWESFKAWVHDNAGWIKVLTEVVSWIATALAIAALFISGIGIVLLLSIMAVALAGHLLLAATGEGSWLDVGLDIVGMITFGTGNVLLRGAEVAGEEMATVGTRAAAAEARAAFREGIAAERKALARMLQKSVTRTAARRGALNRLQALGKLESRAGGREAAALRRTLNAPPSVVSRLLTGDGMVPKIVRNVGILEGRFGLGGTTAAAKTAALRSAAFLTPSYLMDWGRHVSDGYGRAFEKPLIPEIELPIGGDW